MSAPESQVLVHFTAQAVGPSRVDQLFGREYVVFPAVLVKPMVLHNNLGASLLEADVFTDDWAEAWNFAPVVFGDHPTERGTAVSARTPAVLNATGGGFIFSAHISGQGEDAKLKAEVWIETGRAEEVPEIQNVLDMLEASKPVELSTGFSALVEERTGEHNGEEFEFVMRPLGADHLAVFTGAVGACSIAAGCGLGVNQKREEAGVDLPPEETGSEDAPDSVPFYEWLQQSWKRLVGGGAQVGNEMTDDEKRQAISTELRKQFGGPGRDVWIEETFSEDREVVFAIWTQVGGATLHRTTYAISDDGEITFGEVEEVRKVIKFEPVANQDAGTTVTPPTEGNEMTREEMLSQLAAAGPLDEAALNRLSDCQIKALHRAGSGADDADDNEGTVLPPAVNADEPAAGASADTRPEAEGAAAGEVAAQLANIASSLNLLFESVAAQRAEIDQLSDAAAPVVAERQQERATLIQELSANERVPYEAAELEQKGVDELRKLSAMARGEDYSGRGGPRAHEAPVRGVQFAPPKPYWEQAQTTAREA